MQLKFVEFAKCAKENAICNSSFVPVNFKKQTIMENINLIQTKSKLTLSILGNIKNLSETERTNLPKSLLQKTYNLNKILLDKIEFIDRQINKGIINNELEYAESDFEITSSVHHIHQKINSYPKASFTTEVNREDIENQLKKSYELILDFPEDFGLNYRATIENICAVPLDRYQILHLMSLINLDLVHNTKEIMQLEEVYI